MKRFHTLRGRLTALGLLAAVVAVGVLTVAFNVILDRSLDADASGRARSLAAATAANVAYADGRLRFHESVDDEVVDRRVWVYQGTHAIERPAAPTALQRTADSLAGSAHVYDDEPGGDVRLYAEPVTVGGRQIGTVVAAQSLAAYDSTTDKLLGASLVLALLLLAAVGVLTWITVGRALDPVGEMTATAAKWSEHDPGRRFGAEDRPDELGELARTFDALLDRVAASLRHEQRLSAELSHELRTPLARIVAEIELLQRRDRSPQDRSDAYAVVARSAEQMSGILETLMAAARAEAEPHAGRSELGRVLDQVADGWAPAVAEHHLALEVERPERPMTAGVDAEVVERIVAPLIDNALRYARSRVVLSASSQAGTIVLSVADDGPGVAADAGEQVFEPGVRAGEVNGHRGAGLGLPLARRLARAIGGDVTLAPSEPGAGAEFCVRLPG
jgi:signal transduction histidine kinase